MRQLLCGSAPNNNEQNDKATNLKLIWPLMDRRLAQDQDRRGIAENLRSQTLKIHTPKWISKWVWNNKRDTFSSKMRPNFWGHVLAQKTGTPDSDGRSRHSRVSRIFRFFRVPNFWAVFWPHFFSGRALENPNFYIYSVCRRHTNDTLEAFASKNAMHEREHTHTGFTARTCVRTKDSYMVLWRHKIRPLLCAHVPRAFLLFQNSKPILSERSDP